MNGCIDVFVTPDGTTYMAACACGYLDTPQGAVELAELSLLSHFDRSHRSAAA